MGTHGLALLCFPLLQIGARWMVTGLKKRVHSGYKICCYLPRCNRSTNLFLIIGSDKTCGEFFHFQFSDTSINVSATYIRLLIG